MPRVKSTSPCFPMLTVTDPVSLCQEENMRENKYAVQRTYAPGMAFSSTRGDSSSAARMLEVPLQGVWTAASLGRGGSRSSWKMLNEKPGCPGEQPSKAKASRGAPVQMRAEQAFPRPHHNLSKLTGEAIQHHPEVLMNVGPSFILS